MNKLLVIKIGLLTGIVIAIFEAIKLFVIYRYMKMDYYICVVALFFLMIGLLINKTGDGRKLAKPKKIDLTLREMQILKLIADGKTNKEIAGAHFIELSTVKTHINNIYAKLSIHNRREARIRYDEFERVKHIL
jgi:DNA-binding CsgD family transcriptional regulator